MKLDLTMLVAPPGLAPHEWQTKAPSEAWGGRRQPVGKSDDLTRIMALPRRALELDGTPEAERLIDAMTARFTNGVPAGACRCAEIDPERHAAEGCITRLRLTQALALWEIGICGGLLGPIGTGHGKTLLDLLAPFAFARYTETPDILCVLLLPPGLVKQLLRDYDYVGQHFVMPTIVVQGSSESRASPGGPRVQVMPYSRVCLAPETDWFNRVKPSVIIADEVHKLRKPNTATTSRVMRFVDGNPGTLFAGWSGSITSKTIRDYAHLSRMALKLGSPVPIHPDTVDEWAGALDPSKNPCEPGDLFDGLIATGCCRPGESLYTGFSRRLLETRGVVATTSQAVDVPLTITERKAPPIPAEIHRLIKQALGFKRPDGEELITAMEAVACAICVAMGFHYRWIYPRHSFPRDTQLVTDWNARRKEWHKELRYKLMDRDEHLDSILLCQHAAERAYGLRPPNRHLPSWESITFKPWHEIKPLVQAESDSVWLDDYLALDAARWGAEHRGVIWYMHTPFGERLAELSGLPLYAGGEDAKEALLGNPGRGAPGERGERSVIASIKAIGTGTNGLQFYFCDQLFAGGFPADPAACEQTLARLHRPGQPRAVSADFYMHTAQLRKHVLAALRGTSYVEGTTRAQQKMLNSFPAEVWQELELEEDEAE